MTLVLLLSSVSMLQSINLKSYLQSIDLVLLVISPVLLTVVFNCHHEMTHTCMTEVTVSGILSSHR